MFKTFLQSLITTDFKTLKYYPGGSTMKLHALALFAFYEHYNFRRTVQLKTYSTELAHLKVIYEYYLNKIYF